MDSKATKRSAGAVEQPNAQPPVNPDEGIGVFRGILLTLLIYLVLGGLVALLWYLWTHLHLHR